MEKNRLEAFSDGVLAIIITIMVLELKVPHGAQFSELSPLIPVFSSYVLSFIYVGIYWNNHHHLFQITRRVSASILWANLHLLFWLSLLPFAAAWMGENVLAPAPTAVYGVVLLAAGTAYYILQSAIIACEGGDSPLRSAIGRDWKGKISPLIYLLALPFALFQPWVANALYAVVALLWLVPDRRIERALRSHESPSRVSNPHEGETPRP